MICHICSIGCMNLFFCVSKQFSTGFPHDFHTFSTIKNGRNAFMEEAFEKFSTIWAGPIFIYIVYNYIIKEYLHRILDTTIAMHACTHTQCKKKNLA